MAYKVQAAEIKDQFKRFMRYSVRIAPVVVIVGAIAWFFLLRSPDGQTNTSGSTGTPESTPKTTVSSDSSGTKPEAKVPDSSTLAATAGEDDKSKGDKLPETGPGDTLAIFVVTATAGTFFWEWRLRRVKQNS